ncbi:MAG TPA: DNA repair protein RadC [Burkholderiales bacterium]|nr:DNA repair protein RadC [Burkholderiales bacterium]
MGIADWPPDRQPREKLLARGEAALSEPELLAIILRTGVRGKSAVDLARELLERFGTLHGLLEAEPEAIQISSGLGPAKSAQLRAVLALVKRALGQEVQRRDNLSSPQAVRDYLRLHLTQRDREVFVAVYLDAQNRVLKIQELFAGTLTQTSVFPRDVVRHALLSNAAAVIFAHNHPSGLAEPSRADEVLTQALKQALALVDVKVLDHFVVGAGGAMSFAERGLL